MKYKTLKALPWIEVGTVFEYNKDIITGQYWVTLVEWDNIGWLFEFVEWFWLDNDFFEKVEENKIKSFPTASDWFYEIKSYWEIEWVYAHHDDWALYQWNWRWTHEEAKKEVAKRAAIERVRRYIVSNNLLKDESSDRYTIIYLCGGNLESCHYETTRFYSPYGRIKDTDLTQFIEDCREDLLLIHS